MQRTKKRGGWKKRLIIGASIGVVLAGLLITVSRTIYDPFMNDVLDLRTLCPDDVDWMIESKDFPTLVKGLENGGFYGSLDRNADFQRFWGAPENQNSEGRRTLQKTLEALTSRSSEIPGGLEILGDLSGTQVVVAGYDVAAGAAPRVLIVLKPHARSAIIGANVLLSERLYGWFVNGKIKVEKARHEGGLVTLTVMNEGKPLDVTIGRIENAIIAGTDERTVRLVCSRAERGGISPVPVPRFSPEWVHAGADDTSVNVTAKANTFSKYAMLRERVLQPAFGFRYAPAVERFFPNFDGEDVRTKVIVGDLFEARVQTEARARRPVDGVSHMRPLDLDAVRAQLDKVVAKFPHYAFGYIYQSLSPADILAYFLNEPALLDTDKKKLWFSTAIERLPRFAGIPVDSSRVPDLMPRLTRELNACFHDEVGIILFQEKRLEEIEASQPGVAVVMKIKNQDYLMKFIEEISGSIDPKFKDALEFYDDVPGIRYWHVAAKGLVDDRSITDPAFAIIGDYFVFSNWVRVFNDVKDVLQNNGAGFGVRDEILTNLEDLPPGAGGFAFVDAEQLFGYFDSAKAGWVKDRSTVSEAEKYQMRIQFQKQAIAENVAPDQRERFVESHWQAWFQRLSGDKKPEAIRRDIDQKLSHFRTAFRWAFIAAGIDGNTFSGVVRVAARE